MTIYIDVVIIHLIILNLNLLINLKNFIYMMKTLFILMPIFQIVKMKL